MGNCGGFYGAQKIIGEFLVGSYNQYALNSFLALNLVRFVSASKSIDSAKDDDEKIK